MPDMDGRKASDMVTNLAIGVTRPDLVDGNEDEIYVLPIQVQSFAGGMLFARRHPEYCIALLAALDQGSPPEDVPNLAAFLEFTDMFVRRFPID